MKINRANNNGSASIIIPKQALEELNWKVGDECKLKIDEEHLIIQKINHKEYV